MQAQHCMHLQRQACTGQQQQRQGCWCTHHSPLTLRWAHRPQHAQHATCCSGCLLNHGGAHLHPPMHVHSESRRQLSRCGGQPCSPAQDKRRVFAVGVLPAQPHCTPYSMLPLLQGWLPCSAQAVEHTLVDPLRPALSRASSTHCLLESRHGCTLVVCVLLSASPTAAGALCCSTNCRRHVEGSPWDANACQSPCSAWYIPHTLLGWKQSPGCRHVPPGVQPKAAAVGVVAGPLVTCLCDTPWSHLWLVNPTGGTSPCWLLLLLLLLLLLAAACTCPRSSTDTQHLLPTRSPSDIFLVTHTHCWLLLLVEACVCSRSSTDT
jgi:hypothetical protein